MPVQPTPKPAGSELDSNSQAANLPKSALAGKRGICGGISGCIGTTVTQPLDLLKTRFQANPSSQVTKKYSALNCVMQIYRTEGGIRPFFKGLNPSLIGAIPRRAIFFYSYGQYKAQCEKASNFNHLSAGICGSLIANACTSPLWMIKAKCQLDTQTKRRSFFYHCKNIWRQSGVKGFYRGLGATCAISIGEGVTMMMYESLKNYLAKSEQQPTAFHYLIASGCSGIAKSITFPVFYPAEVIRLQLQKDSTKSYRQILFKEMRFVHLYSGLRFHMLKVVVSTMVVFGMYEYISQYIKM